MPTYDYACDNCGHRFDVRQSFSDEPIRECPKCTSAVRRVLYASGVIFKGSGWYINDSRPSGSGSKDSSSSSDSPSSDTSKKSEGATSSSDSAEKSSGSEPKAPTKAKDKPKATAKADD